MVVGLRLLVDRFLSPIGMIRLVHDDRALRALEFHDRDDRLHRLLRCHYGTYRLEEAKAPGSFRLALEAYFAGDLHAIDDLPVETGGTPFQKEVWRALREIPAGETISYGAQAQRIGKPKAVRAVGLANGSNPVGIVVPCHRVIGANGSLTGYGGGLPRKRWLLAHERRAAEPSLFDALSD
ncbi:MAG TPA: methylated-DNA--[protein]-cysteine S-methyltransferase [Lichenihabitans sp.]|nr:methylated-DNA--[protein]-cysteine S-methyltransferase [Lichenihabitans sp.]